MRSTNQSSSSSSFSSWAGLGTGGLRVKRRLRFLLVVRGVDEGGLLGETRFLDTDEAGMGDDEVKAIALVGLGLYNCFGRSVDGGCGFRLWTLCP